MGPFVLKRARPAIVVALSLGLCAPLATAGGARKYQVVEPTGYDGGRPLPLVMLLHGYKDTPLGINLWFKLQPVAEARGVFYVNPSGTMDRVGHHFWNATDACCNYEGSGVDDVAYLTKVLDEVVARYRVDPRRIYIVGHSNGGFMAHRLACELSPRIAAIVSVAGASWFDGGSCPTTGPVSVLQVHGDLDDNVFYDGGWRRGVPYPSAAQTVEGWGARNGCSGKLEETATRLDLDKSVPGAETTVAKLSGCPDGGAAELWTVHGGDHKPRFRSEWPGVLLDWLLAHPK